MGAAIVRVRLTVFLISCRDSVEYQLSQSVSHRGARIAAAGFGVIVASLAIRLAFVRSFITLRMIFGAGAQMMKPNSILVMLLSASAISGCTFLPNLNAARTIEVRQMVDVVSCEVGAAALALGNKEFHEGSWDVKSSLDLTLVQQLDADGKIVWAIPVSNALTPSASVSHKQTSIAHVDFITLVKDAKLFAQTTHCADFPDPSQTGLGLAEWIKTTFKAVGKEDNAGLSYTREFELTAAAGPRFGFGFVTAVTGEVGLGATRIDTHRLTVTVSPHVEGGPTKVIIVGGEKSVAGQTRRQQIITNPIGNMNLLRQAPVKLQSGTLLR